MKIAIVLIFVAFASYILIEYSHISFFVVTTNSMNPGLSAGSFIVTRRVKEYEVGDVVSYRYMGRPDAVVTHRIVSKQSLESKNFFKTKGDANLYEDFPLVSRDEIIGKVFVLIPILGKILNDFIVLGLLFYVPAGIVFGLSLKQIWRCRKEL